MPGSGIDWASYQRGIWDASNHPRHIQTSRVAITETEFREALAKSIQGIATMRDEGHMEPEAFRTFYSALMLIEDHAAAVRAQMSIQQSQWPGPNQDE